MKEKKCIGCKRTKPLSAFQKNAHGNHKGNCRDCIKDGYRRREAALQRRKEMAGMTILQRYRHRFHKEQAA